MYHDSLGTAPPESVKEFVAMDLPYTQIDIQSLGQRIFGAPRASSDFSPARRPALFLFFPARDFHVWLLLATANRPLGLAKILVHIIAVIVLD